MSRIWRLDIGENVQEIEKFIGYEKSLPIQVRGRVLDEKECVQDINVADNDILMYEVQANTAPKSNNYFSFIPKAAVDKQR